MLSKYSLCLIMLALIFQVFDTVGICPTKRSCLDLDNPCPCYCSRVCSPRAKEEDDNPVFIHHDHAGHHLLLQAMGP